MTKLPGAMVVIDVTREVNAVREARKLGIPTVCLIDTDSNPDFADIPIPGNDDAMRAIEVVIQNLCAAVMEGKQGRTTQQGKEGDEARGGDQGQGERGGDRPRRSSRAKFRADDQSPEEVAAASEAGQPAAAGAAGEQA